MSMRRRLYALIVVTLAIAAPVTAQCAGSYQKEPMFPDLASVEPSSHSPSFDSFTSSQVIIPGARSHPFQQSR